MPSADTYTPGVRGEHGSRRASNIVTQMKMKLLMWKASALSVSPYTNHLGGRKGTHRAHRRVTAWTEGLAIAMPPWMRSLHTPHGKHLVGTSATVRNKITYFQAQLWGCNVQIHLRCKSFGGCSNCYMLHIYCRR